MRRNFYRKNELKESEDSKKMESLVDSVISRKARVETIRVNEPDLFEAILELGREEARSGNRVRFSSKAEDDAFCAAFKRELEQSGTRYAPTYDA